jgi:hypothetical protein
MKKVVSSLLIIGCLISVSSCVTGRSRSSWHGYPPVPFSYQYRIDKVLVIIDHVREDNIAQQLKVIAETHIEPQQKRYQENDEIVFLDITVEQRSFMQNVEMYNSIYVSFTAHDGGETVYARENEFISSKQTFISVPVQRAIITRILNRLLVRQQIRYTDVKNYKFFRSLRRTAQAE